MQIDIPDIFSGVLLSLLNDRDACETAKSVPASPGDEQAIKDRIAKLSPAPESASLTDSDLPTDSSDMDALRMSRRGQVQRYAKGAPGATPLPDLDNLDSASEGEVRLANHVKGRRGIDFIDALVLVRRYADSPRRR